MKVGILKKDKRYETRNDPYLNIQYYGEYNDYPQQVRQVIKASGTGRTCVEVYAKFIFGKGFLDDRLYGLKLNRFGHTADHLLELVARDLATFGGFAIHMNFNANSRVIELQHVPFETVRFERMGEDNTFNKVAIHPDWGKTNQKIHAWNKKDISFVDLYTPDPAGIIEGVKRIKGWKSYKGQVYYYSNEGERTYPTPVLDTALTDMSSEEGISNVSNRSVRNGFLPAGMLIDYCNVDETEDQEGSTEEDLLDYQGDEKAGKIMYVQVKSVEEEPKWIPFKGPNYAQEFLNTEKSVQTNIGKVFNQPPILRAENVSANFGSEIMKQAYNYYNSVTNNERVLLERVFTELFILWDKTLGVDFRIDPLSYDTEMTFAERVGKEGVDQILKILESTALNDNQKRQAIRTLFSPTAEELDGLMPSTI